MEVRVESVEFDVRECRARLPFRFGAATVTWAPLITARSRIRTEDGRAAEGRAADLAMPKWFDKDPDKTVEDNVADLEASARLAAGKITGLSGSVFDVWWRTYADRVGSTPEDAPDRLVRGFGVALVERTVIDAACRAAGVSFFRALKDDLFGFYPARAHAELSGWSLAASLPDAPLDSIRVRHTIGGVDPLRVDEIAPEDRVDDGLPQALEEDVDRYGLTCFKIKLGGDPRRDARRLFDLAAFFGGRPVELTVDANEQYDDLAELGRVLDVVGTTDEGARFLEGLLYVEQPLHRAASFDPAATAAMLAVAEYAPVILDEADHGIEAFPRALELGYGGVSVKNCKGVFRALINRGLCETRGGFQSAEDLTNLPAVPLQQDLATVAALGLEHAERNGHHYFRGLDHLDEDERRAALIEHPDLYEERDGGAFLRIENGRLAVGSLQSEGFG